jgi:hypothetical protein
MIDTDNNPDTAPTSRNRFYWPMAYATGAAYLLLAMALIVGYLEFRLGLTIL